MPRSVIAIVGGAGFVGVNLARQAVESGHRVDLYDLGDRLGRLAHSGTLEDDGIDFEILRANKPFEFPRRPDSIVHLAAWPHVEHSIHEGRAVAENNVMSLVSVLEEAVRLSCPVLFTSSVEVYGGNTGASFSERSPYDPLSPYAASKVAGEALVRAYRAAFSLQACVVRLTNLYGPWQAPDRLVPRVIAQLLTGHSCEVERGRVRDFLYVDDAVEALMTLLRDADTTNGRTFNVSTGSGVSSEYVASQIAEFVGSGAQVVHRPPREHDGRGTALVSSRSELTNATNWIPSTPLEFGLCRTVAWYEQNVAWWKPFERHYSIDRNGPDFLLDYPIECEADDVTSASATESQA